MSRTAAVRKRRIKSLGLYAVLSVIALLFVGPFLMMTAMSLKSSAEDLFAFPTAFVPLHPTLGYFREAWTTIPYARLLVNSMLYEVLIVPLYLLISALAAYPLARIRFRGRQVVFLLLLSTMFVPGEIMLIPRFLVMSRLGLTDSYWAVVIPGLLSGLGIFLLRQAFSQIPDELSEAAIMDGASQWRLFWSICLPLVRPTLAVLGILGFISVWNSFVWPMVVLTDLNKYPLALGISYLSGIAGTDVRGLAAGSLISLIPIFIVFLALQRQIIAGMSGAVKG